jgi:glycerol-1-phosphate dehydrogenase [NAD(P)+]
MILMSELIKEIVIKKGALKEIPELLTRLTDEKRIYLIVDHNTFEAAGKELAEILKKDYQVKPVFLDGEVPVPDPDSIFTILEGIDSKGYILACGSGTINDLCKFISYKLNRPYTIVATAPSMDGYSSSVAPLTVQGIKKTYQAVSPEAIIADLDILQESPWELIQAGFGDLLGKATSLLDWQLGRILFNEYYSSKAVDLVKDSLVKIIKPGHRLKERDIETIEVLSQGLIDSGLAMLMVGNSRPASGSEHHISHFLEMYGLMYNQKLPTHGIKVGLATYFTSVFYLRLKELDFSLLKINDDREERARRIKEDYLERAEPVLNVLTRRKEVLTTARLREKEREIKEVIGDYSEYLLEIKDLLNDSGILEREDIRSLRKSWLLKALQSGFEIRERYTVTTLLKQLGLLDSWSNELLADWPKI